jgi:TonB family protein
LSKVFDARRNAERSIRAQKAGAGPSPASAERTPDPQTQERRVAAPPEAAKAPGVGIVRSLLRTPRPDPGQARPRPAAASGEVNALPQRTRIEPATLISSRDPVYPVTAQQSQISGSVEVHFRISPQGKVYDAKSVKGSPILAQAAIEAVREWCYQAARLNGVPIDSQATTNFVFDLN